MITSNPVESRGLNDVARIHQPQADAPGDGCGDIAVNQIHFHRVDQALIVLHDPFVLLDKRDLRGQLLLGNRVLFDQRFIARLVDLRVVEQSLVADELPFVLRQLRLIRPRIDFGELVALMHHVALFVEDLHQLAVHASLHRHGVDGGYRAEPRDVYADVAPMRFGCVHRSHGVGSWSVLAATFATARSGRRLSFEPVVIATAGEQNEQQKPNPEPMLAAGRAAGRVTIRKKLLRLSRRCDLKRRTVLLFHRYLLVIIVHPSH